MIRKLIEETEKKFQVLSTRMITLRGIEISGVL